MGVGKAKKYQRGGITDEIVKDYMTILSDFLRSNVVG